MKSQEKIDLLQKYLQGQCSAEETELVQAFLQQADEEEELNQLLDEVWQNMLVYPEVSSQTSENMYQAISVKLHLKQQNVAEEAEEIRPATNLIWRIAAVVTMLLMLSGMGYRLFLYAPDEVRQTGFGQTATVTLPDESVVMLNGNSSIRYKKDWSSDAIREVWLEGEGFFKVMPMANHQKFVVHTADKVNVEVLGTTFTVAKRRLGTRVVLNTGKVRLNLQQGEDRPASVILEPGDLVQVKHNTKALEKRRVDPNAYSAWTKQRIVFKNTPLREVIALLEETYGLQIVVSDTALYNRKISGSTPINKNFNMFFTGLEQTFDLKITHEQNRVLFEKQPVDTQAEIR